MNAADPLPIETRELDVLARLVPLSGSHLIELGCGNARLARDLIQRYPSATYVGLEVGTQHARNLERPQAGMTFLPDSATAIPCADASFDIALMLKSLHHIPMPQMGQALAEIARVLRPGGWLYVSEPIYDGALNDIVRLYNDEGTVRAAAQSALDAALAAPDGERHWEAADELRFATPAHFATFAEFEQRMMYPSFADHRIDAAMTERVRAAFEPHLGPDGADFVRPMHVRLLRRLT